jgi:excisionase family DNA binding protein
VECEQIKNELVKFMDNEVSHEMREAVEAHLNSCADCSKELESMLEVRKLSRSWKDISPSRDWGIELKRKLAKSQSQPMTEMELLKSAIIGLSRRVKELEESQAYLPPTLESEIMTIDELARYLRLSVEQIYDIIDQLPRFQIGYEYRFKRESIDQWIRSLEQRPYPQDYLWGNWSQREE